MSTKPIAENARKLLIVDDNDGLRENLADIAKLYDFTVRISPDAEDAIKTSSTYQPDVVLLDVRLPGISGLVACPLIQHIAPNARIIIMSGYVEIEDAQQSLGSCAEAVFKKPLDCDLLFALIGKVR